MLLHHLRIINGNGRLKQLNGLMKFEPDPYDGYAVEYINPSNGHTANPTMACLDAETTKRLPYKSTSSYTFIHLSCTSRFRYTVINGVRFDWKKGDYFVVPNWAWHEHVAAEDSYLFSVNDLPIMERFDLEQGQVLDINSGKQEVKSEFKPVLV